jgi:ATP:corrinoid adenosyltransferase
VHSVTKAALFRFQDNSTCAKNSGLTRAGHGGGRGQMSSAFKDAMRASRHASEVARGVFFHASCRWFHSSRFAHCYQEPTFLHAA